MRVSKETMAVLREIAQDDGGFRVSAATATRWAAAAREVAS